MRFGKIVILSVSLLRNHLWKAVGAFADTRYECLCDVECDDAAVPADTTSRIQ